MSQVLPVPVRPEPPESLASQVPRVQQELQAQERLEPRAPQETLAQQDLKDRLEPLVLGLRVPPVLPDRQDPRALLWEVLGRPVSQVRQALQVRPVPQVPLVLARLEQQAQQVSQARQAPQVPLVLG